VRADNCAPHRSETPSGAAGQRAQRAEDGAGFWIWQVNSMADAIDWLKRAPFGGGVEIEIRPIFEAEDFVKNLTPELREQEQRLRQQVAAKQ
jgi:hypothetical protein